MTRNRAIDPAVLEREYVFDPKDPGISITDLAEKYGLARSGVAAKATTGKWFEKRTEFRKELSAKTREALAQKWVAFETETREKMLKAAGASLDSYMAALAEGKITVSSKDAVQWVGAMRVLLGDQREEHTAAGARDVTPDEDLSPEGFREAVQQLQKMIGAGTQKEGADGSSNGSLAGPPGETAPTGEAGSGED
jgi:hypothetical protein